MNTDDSTGPGLRMTRRAGFGLAAAALTAGLMPAARAESGDDGSVGTREAYVVKNYMDSADDAGGYGARVSTYVPGGGFQQADFDPYGETLMVRNGPGTNGLWVEVGVYRSADSSGEPYDLIDSDTFHCPRGKQKFDLGTPDGSGNIAEGRWVSIRMLSEAVGEWSRWARGKA